jgi:hypothetical protein
MTVPVVFQQDVVIQIGDVQIGVTVIVEVACRDAHPVCSDTCTALVGDVFEGAVAAVVIQTVPAAACWIG